jgi:hypothetical protein
LTAGSLTILLVAPLVAPPVGAVGLTTTGIIGAGLGFADARLSGSGLKAFKTGVEAVVSFGGGRLALKVGGYTVTKYIPRAERYFSEGHFVKNAVGRSAFQLEGAAEAATSIPFMLLPD